MSGTKAGGKKCAATNKRKYGENWYAEIGKKGGLAPTTAPKGFAANPQLARQAGRKGGLISSKAPTMSLAERRNEIAEMLKQEEELTAYEVS